MRPPGMSALPPAGGISDSGSRAGQASEPFGRPADDLQSSDRYPAGTPVTEASRPTRGTISSSGGAQRAGRTGDGYPEFPDDGRPLAQEDGRGAAGARERSALEAQAHAADPADALFDLPAEPVVATPGSGRAFPEDDADKPKGPDLAELRTVIAAARRESENFRAKARQRHDLVPAHLSDDEKKSLLQGEGRLAKPATLQTQKDYLARGQKLFERFNRETGSHVAREDLDPRGFVDWLLSLKPVLSPNSWRHYRASARAAIQGLPSHDVDAALGMLHADLHVGADEGGKGDRKGAALRAKRMDYQHFQQLRRSLSLKYRSKPALWLTDWLDAGIHTGLRPAEWAFTSIERRADKRYPHGERIWLHVVNAKDTERRIAYRTLDISHFSTDVLGAVERMVTRSRDWLVGGQSARNQGHVADLLRQVCGLIFPRMQIRYTLYSLRHQFIANMKTIYSREELAAMVGQITLETRVEHYQKRRASWLKHEITELPMPVEEQVKRMNTRLALLDERRALNARFEAAKKGQADDTVEQDGELGYQPGE